MPNTFYCITYVWHVLVKKKPNSETPIFRPFAIYVLRARCSSFISTRRVKNCQGNQLDRVEKSIKKSTFLCHWILYSYEFQMREICIYRPQVSPQEFSKPWNNKPTQLPFIDTQPQRTRCFILSLLYRSFNLTTGR